MFSECNSVQSCYECSGFGACYIFGRDHCQNVSGARQERSETRRSPAGVSIRIKWYWLKNGARDSKWDILSLPLHPTGSPRAMRLTLCPHETMTSSAEQYPHTRSFKVCRGCNPRAVPTFVTEAFMSSSKTVAPIFPNVTAVFNARQVFPGDSFPLVKARISHMVRDTPTCGTACQ